MQFVRARLDDKQPRHTDDIYCFLCFKDTVYSDKKKWDGVRRDFNLLFQEYDIVIDS